MNDSPHPSRDTDFQYVAQILVPDALVGGRYRLLEPLGRGGYSIVWSARDEHLNMDVAIKFLSDLIVNNPEALGDLKRETRLSLQLTHPNIVRIYGFVQEEHVAGISMELVEGGTLAALKSANQARALQPEDLKPMMRPLFEALQYAHEVVEVVHRDLKPANLMVDSKGLLRIADFGISSSLNDTRTRDTAQVSGTVAYMSPEQIAGRPASVTDDVYSLGATLFDLLAGKPPFYQGNIIGQVVSVDPPAIQDRRKELGIDLAPVPEVWEKTIHACLEKEAAKRPQTIREVAERLGIYDITDSRSGAAAAEDAGSVRPSKPGISLAAIGGGVVAALVAGALVFHFATRDGGGDGGDEAGTPIASRAPVSAGDAGRKDGAAAAGERAREATPDGGANVVANTGANTGVIDGANTGAREDATETPADGAAPGTVTRDQAAADIPAGAGDSGQPPQQSAEDQSAPGDAVAGVDPAREAVAGEAPARGDAPAAGAQTNAPPDVGAMRVTIESSIAARDWDGAMEGIESLVDAAPGEIALAHQLTQQLSEAKEAEARANRAEELRTEIRALADRGSWVSAGDLIDELDALVPGDGEVRAWKAARSEARAASLPAAIPAGQTAPSGETVSATSKEQDEAAIRAVITSYESALEALDVDRYASLWVSMPGSERSKIERAFRDLESQSIEITGTSFAQAGQAATVKFQQKQTIRMKVGSDPPPVDRTRSMKLIKTSDGRWLIDSIQ
ncbi:MAG: protein kinase [Gemmatimonadetes bacterium]|nr:protein kinase [Gemmatimonadota bacterium]